MEKTFYRGGAPKKTDAEKKERMVQIRLTTAQYKQLQGRKDQTMAKDMSDFIRAVCLDKPLLLKTPTDAYQDIALSLIREMRADILRIGVNINQSCRRINSTTDYHALKHDVSQMSTNISDLDAQLGVLLRTLSGQPQPTNLPHDDCPDQ